MQDIEEPSEPLPDLAGMVDAAIEQLPLHVKRATHVACERHLVPDEQLRAVLWWVHRMRHFEANKAAVARTPAERIDSLRVVADAVERLEEAIDALSLGDQLQVEHEMQLAERDLPPAMKLMVASAGAGVEAADAGLVIRSVLSRLTWSARLVASHLEFSTKGGRRPVLAHYAGFVEGLLGAVEGSGMRLGRSGKFEKFCSEIFAIAGIPSSAEGAVRELVESRKKQPS